MPMHFTPLGDSALIVEIGSCIDEPTHRRVQAVMAQLTQAGLAAVTELVPAYTTVTVFYDPMAAVSAGAPVNDIAGWLTQQIQSVLLHGNAVSPQVRPGRLVEIPVCYGGDYGPDLPEVAERRRLAPADVVRLHSTSEFFVYLLGFSPGFAYMGGLPPALALPRRASPRKIVPPGSVGIVNDQTCIYPQATPGGWNLIGRTPLRLFTPGAQSPTLLQPGDRVRFRAVTPEEFARLEGQP